MGGDPTSRDTRRTLVRCGALRLAGQLGVGGCSVRAGIDRGRFLGNARRRRRSPSRRDGREAAEELNRLWLPLQDVDDITSEQEEQLAVLLTGQAEAIDEFPAFPLQGAENLQGRHR